MVLKIIKFPQCLESEMSMICKWSARPDFMIEDVPFQPPIQT